MRWNFNACVNWTLLPGNDGQPFHITPNDPGEATSWGITRSTYSRWLGRPASDDDMRNLAIMTAHAIYLHDYWRPIAGDNLPPGIDLMVFDHGVVCGVHEAAVELQATLDVETDGMIGPITLAAAQAADPHKTIDMLAFFQRAHYRSRKDFPIFGEGWLARVDRRAAAAAAMLPGRATT